MTFHKFKWSFTSSGPISCLLTIVLYVVASSKSKAGSCSKEDESLLKKGLGHKPDIPERHTEVSNEYLKWERFGEKCGLQFFLIFIFKNLFIYLFIQLRLSAFSSHPAVFNRSKYRPISIQRAHSITWHQRATESRTCSLSLKKASPIKANA